MTYEKELKIAKDIALQAGKIMLEYFEGNQGLEHKDDGSVVTVADKKINRLVIEELSKHFDDGIIGEEESNSEYGPGRKWFCDPIDGTKAFVLGVPTATFSLALIIDGSSVLGVVYDPFLDRLYWGIKGQGSYCNGKKLRVSENELTGHYIGVSVSDKEVVEKPDAIKKLIKLGAKLDTTHGAVYKSCLIAHGRTVAYFERRLNPHDVAAVHVIVEEAGGLVTDYEGNPLDYTKPFKKVVLSNKKVHADLLKCLQE